MARYKRYFPVSHDINLDPEFDRLCKETGLAGVRFFLQLLAMLDKTENHICLNSGWNMQMLSRICGTKPKMLLTSYELLIDMKWISVGVDDDMNMFIHAPNYAEYHRSRGRNVETLARIGVPPIPSLPFPIPKEEEKRVSDAEKTPKRRQNSSHAKHKKSGWPEDLVLTPHRRELAERYWKNRGVSFDVEVVWGKFESGSKAAGKIWADWDQAWVTWYSNQVDFARNGHGKASSVVCLNRIAFDGRLKDCGKPGVHQVGKRPLCEDCYAEYQERRLREA